MTVAEVCVNVAANSIDKNFTYRVPERFNFLTAGWRVIVPFGAQRVVGFIMNVSEFDDATKFEFKLKEILYVIDEEAWFTPEMLKAARWLAEFYLCPLSQTMGLFMSGRRVKKIPARFEKIYKLARPFEEKNFKNKPAQLKLLKLLSERGEIKADKKNFAVAKILIAAGYVSAEQRRILRDSYSEIKSVPRRFELTAEQVAAIETVEKFLAARKFQGFLLYGVTGSSSRNFSDEPSRYEFQSAFRGRGGYPQPIDDRRT